jgi:hypothetical protein
MGLGAASFRGGLFSRQTRFRRGLLCQTIPFVLLDSLLQTRRGGGSQRVSLGGVWIEGDHFVCITLGGLEIFSFEVSSTTRKDRSELCREIAFLRGSLDLRAALRFLLRLLAPLPLALLNLLSEVPERLGDQGVGWTEALEQVDCPLVILRIEDLPRPFNCLPGESLVFFAFPAFGQRGMCALAQSECVGESRLHGQDGIGMTNRQLDVAFLETLPRFCEGRLNRGTASNGGFLFRPRVFDPAKPGVDIRVLRIVASSGFDELPGRCVVLFLEFHGCLGEAGVGFPPGAFGRCGRRLPCCRFAEESSDIRPVRLDQCDLAQASDGILKTPGRYRSCGVLHQFGDPLLSLIEDVRLLFQFQERRRNQLVRRAEFTQQAHCLFVPAGGQLRPRVRHDLLGSAFVFPPAATLVKSSNGLRSDLLRLRGVGFESQCIVGMSDRGLEILLVQACTSALPCRSGGPGPLAVSLPLAP